MRTFSPALLSLLLVVGAAGVVGVERASAVTNSEVTELFIVLEIIPEEKAEQARAVEAGQDEGVTIEELVELYIALEIVPEDKAEQARAVIDGQGAIAPYAPPGGLHIELVRTSAEVVQDRRTERGQFMVMFDMTAVQDTFYVHVDPQRSIRHFIEGGIYGALAPSPDLQEVTLTSSALRVGDWYVVESGDTETFTLENVFTPTADGAYTFELGYVEYADKTTTGNRYFVEATPRADYRTEPLELSVRSRVSPQKDRHDRFERTREELTRRAEERREELRNRAEDCRETMRAHRTDVHQLSVSRKDERVKRARGSAVR